MKIVRVTYSTSHAYADTNKEKIRAVMRDLKQLAPAGISYQACLSPDGTTFVHTAFFKADDDQKLLQNLPSFKHFQEQLMASGPVQAPRQEILTLVGSSNNIFDPELPDKNEV